MPKLTLSTALLASAFALASVGVRAADTGESAYQPLPGDEKQSLDHLLQQGVTAAGHQDWPATIRYYVAAHHVAPQDPEPLFNLGLAASQLPGRELKAIAWFEAFLEAAPTDPRAPQVRLQIGRLRDGARAHALRLFAVAEKAVMPLQPKDRWQPDIELATTAARLDDGDLVVRWLANWGEDRYRDHMSTYAEVACTLPFGIDKSGFAKLLGAAGTATDARAHARSWERVYLTAALDNKGSASVAGRCAPKPDDKPKLSDEGRSFALGEIARADVELGRTEEAEALLRQLQALSDAKKTDRAALISLIAVKIALGKRADAERDLRDWYGLAQAGDFYVLRDSDGRVAVDDWSALGNTAEARRVIDLYQSAATKAFAASAASNTQLSPVDDQQRHDILLMDTAGEQGIYLTIMRLALAIGDFPRATDALDQAWQIGRKGQAFTIRFATTHPRNQGSSYESSLTDDFYAAELELGQSLLKAGNQAALDSLIGSALARARIEQQDDARLPPLPPLKEYKGTMMFPDRGIVRSRVLRQKLTNLMKLVALSGDRAKVAQYADFVRSVVTRGDNAATLIELAELELRTSGPAEAKADLLAAVGDIEHCSDKFYDCDASQWPSTWSSGPGLLLLLPKGDVLLDDHLRAIQRSNVWSNVRKSFPTDTLQHYTHALRRRAAELPMQVTFDAFENATAPQRAQAWAAYAEWALPGYAALDDRNFIGDSLSTTESALGSATFSWHAINEQINALVDELTFVNGKDRSQPVVSSRNPS